MKYLCLAYEDERILNDLTPTDWHALRAETLAYVDALRRSGRLIDARPLQSASTAATLRVRNGRPSITDGPFAETKEQLGGYFLIDAASLDDALSVAANWPSARFGTIEVRAVDDELGTESRYRQPARG